VSSSTSRTRHDSISQIPLSAYCFGQVTSTLNSRRHAVWRPVRVLIRQTC
jgi:hypothetical protein